MGRKVYISVLGTSFYEKITYAGITCQTETRFVQEATLRDIGADGWSTEDMALILLTEKARDYNWNRDITMRKRSEESEPEPYSGLELALELMNLRCMVKGVSIKDGKDESEIWEIFNVIYALLNEEDELYFDLTHAFRYLPMLLLVLGNYAKFLKNTKIMYMAYGNYEARKDDIAPIIDLLPLASLQDWSFAAGQFIQSGNTDFIVDLGRSKCSEIKYRLRQNDTESFGIKNYLAALKSVSDDLMFCRGINLIDAVGIADMRIRQQDVKEETIPAFTPLISKITDSFSTFDEKKNFANTYSAAKWCYEKHFYQLAVTFLREGVVSVICGRFGLDEKNETDRKLVDDAFFVCDRKKTNEREQYADTSEICRNLLTDPVYQDEELVNIFNNFRNIRNDLNHSGMRGNACTVNSLKSSIERAIKKLESVFVTDSSNAIPVSSPKPPIFINLSNHPFTCWSEKQLADAREYGEPVDLPFPDISPEIEEKELKTLADEYFTKVRDLTEGKTGTVHIMGEMTFTYALVRRLNEYGIRCIASTSERIVKRTLMATGLLTSVLSDSETTVNRSDMKEKNIELNAGQKDALERVIDFLQDKDSKVFILKGYAGTGKTTIIKSLINRMTEKNIDFVLLASTGRAAKILSDVTGHPANTIHSEIYSFRGFSDNAKSINETDELKYVEGMQLFIQFDLKNEHSASDVYIVDESSMIADRENQLPSQSKFGKGRLLTDLLRYDKKAKFIFVGDPCQLPPISGELSPALSVDYFKQEFGINAREITLTEVMRQKNDSGLVMAATEIRKFWEAAPENELIYKGVNRWEKLPFRGVPNLELVESVNTLAQKYLNDIRGNKYTNATFICKSNVNCYNFSQAFREVLGFKGNLQVGELLLAVQNNLISGIRNGDLLIVKNISSRTEKRADLTFREIEVEELFTERKFKQLLMEDILYQPQPNLDSDQQSRLFVDFIIRMKKIGITEKFNREQFKDRMMIDKYLNALRVSFGYALTCHKAQGGEWKNVYSYFPRNIMLNPTKQKYQWVYTAMTRAQEKFFVVDDIYIEGFGRGRMFW